jgi:hypothetical protein
MIELTVEELLPKLDEIMESYGQGSDTDYLIKAPTGDVVLTPYNGPYTETVQEDDEGNYFVKIPDRLISKKGWTTETKLELDIVAGEVIISEQL